MKDVVVAGLGNPGKAYQDTLHNIGFKVVENLAKRHSWSFKREAKFQAEVARGTLKETNFHLLKPETYMNLSGEAVASYLNFYRLSIDDLIVVVDDADLDLGVLRLKGFGGTAGHNGLKSIEYYIKSSQFKRLKVGIGRPLDAWVPLADYVLAPVGNAVWEKLEATIEKASLFLEELGFKSFEAVMKAANTKVEMEKS